MRYITLNNNILGVVSHSEELMRELEERKEEEIKFRQTNWQYEKPNYYQGPKNHNNYFFGDRDQNNTSDKTESVDSLATKEKIHGLPQRRHYPRGPEEAELHSIENAQKSFASNPKNTQGQSAQTINNNILNKSNSKKTTKFADEVITDDLSYANIAESTSQQRQQQMYRAEEEQLMRRQFEERGTSPIDFNLKNSKAAQRKKSKGNDKFSNQQTNQKPAPAFSQQLPSQSLSKQQKDYSKQRPRSIPMGSKSQDAVPKEFSKETWTKKLQNKDESWTTCNKEYGTNALTGRKSKVVRMDGLVREEPDDGGPWMASQYQMGYNIKPEMKEKWMNSWKGYVKKKTDISDYQLQDMIAPNTYKNKSPPMIRGEGWVDDGPWGASTYQMGYNVSPRERDPKPIYRFTRDEQVNKIEEESKGNITNRSVLSNTNEEAEKAAFNALKSLPKSVKIKKSNSGVRLPPIPNVSDSARQDIQLHNGHIYMADQQEKKTNGVNEQFFKFKYRPHWKPMPLYKTASLK